MSDDRQEKAAKALKENYPKYDHVYTKHPHTGEDGVWGRRHDDHTKIEKLDDE